MKKILDNLDESIYLSQIFELYFNSEIYYLDLNNLKYIAINKKRF
jgi:hypothetical protein